MGAGTGSASECVGTDSASERVGTDSGSGSDSGSGKVKTKTRTFSNDDNVWVVKDALANGGCAVWVMGPGNWEQVVEDVAHAITEPAARSSGGSSGSGDGSDGAPAGVDKDGAVASSAGVATTSGNHNHGHDHSGAVDARGAQRHLVVQQHVPRMLLWGDGHKFHFRLYTVVTAELK